MKILPVKLLLFFLFFCSSSFSQQLVNQRQITLLEKAKRPDDFWPRGDGHIVLAEPGRPLYQKVYCEPGGSFSPLPGSFDLSIWVMDKDTNVVATSDNVFVDGKEVTEKPWVISKNNYDAVWVDSDFEIPVAYTKGKSSVVIKLKHINNYHDWTAFSYDVFCYR